MPASRVYVVGVGAEGRASLAVGAAEIVDGAELLVGGARHLAMFPESRAERVSLAEGLKVALDRIEASMESRKVVVLASGDPGFFGIARPIVERLGRDRVAIIPNVSSLQIAFARLGESWEDALFASVHGRPLEGLAAVIKGVRKAAILTGGENTPSVVARWLLGAGVSGYRVYLCEELGGPEESVREFDLQTLAGVETARLNVLVLLRDGEASPDARSAAVGPVSPIQPGRIQSGIPEDRFLHRGGMITKAEIRVVSLAKLGLGDESIVWDVGAGSGSVSIEAALLARRGRVYATERDPEQLESLRRNVAGFALENVVVVEGEAPVALEGLPEPDAVFIGGSGGKLAAILDLVCARLNPQGRIVVNAATLETVGTATTTLRQLGFEVDVTLMQISRGKMAGSLTRFEALDPVFIVAAQRQ